MPQLNGVQIVAEPDQDPILDHLGEYSNDPGPADRTVDRKERGDHARGEKRYFISYDYEYVEENYERMEKFATGHLACYGVHAEATVTVNGVKQTIRSGGMWGLPSDTDSDYLAEIAREELSELKEILAEIGVEVAGDLGAEWSGPLGPAVVTA